MSTLTEQEKRILALIQQGCTNYQIAVKADISPTKLIYAMRSIKDKLGVQTKEELIAMRKGYQHGNN